MKGMEWSIESADASSATYVARLSIEGRHVEARCVLDKSIGKFMLRLISIKPIGEAELSLLTAITGPFRLLIDYAPSDKAVVMYPMLEAKLFDSLDAIARYLESLLDLVREVLLYAENPRLESEANEELVRRGWVVDLTELRGGMFKVYDAGPGLFRVEVIPEGFGVEYVRVRVNVFVKARDEIGCMANALLNKGFSCVFLDEELGIGEFESSYLSLGIKLFVAEKVDSLIQEVIRSCGK